MENNRFASISAINRYINYKFETDINLQEVYLQGEISNFKYSGKHCYFSLKDEFSEISAMFFYPANLNLTFVPKDGTSVQVCGKIQIYQKKGTYAIIISKMAETGIGLLYQEYLQLKDKLQKEGLFDESKKLLLPAYPEKIAIITAPTGEAINDIVSTFNKRFPLAKLKLYPSLVQGVDAPKSLIKALKQVYLENDADAIIIGRGGGSFEDLSCFNDELLARTIFESKIPIVSAVGHEGDYTICDFVASYRAPTPTAAAIALSKDKNDLTNLIYDFMMRIKLSIKNILTSDYQKWKTVSNSFVLTNFDKIIENKYLLVENLRNIVSQYSFDRIYDVSDSKLNEQILKLENNFQNNIFSLKNKYLEISNRLNHNLIINRIEQKNQDILQINDKINLLTNTYLENNQVTLNNLIDKLVILNPLSLMNKGYSIVYKDHQIITKTNQLISGDDIRIVLSDGQVDATIK